MGSVSCLVFFPGEHNGCMEKSVADLCHVEVAAGLDILEIRSCYKLVIIFHKHYDAPKSENVSLDITTNQM